MEHQEQLLSLEEALKELQIERDELKELFRQNALRYILDQGKIKIPKMALMALKLERMTSSTQQFSQMKRARKRGTTLTASVGEAMLSAEEAAQMLEVDCETIQEYIAGNLLRYTKSEGDVKIPKSSAQALKIQIVSFGPVTRLPKNRPAVRRVY